MILSPEKMADIRQYSKNVQEINVIETFDAQIAEYKMALRWSLLRLDLPMMWAEGLGSYPDLLDNAKKLAYPFPERES
jgi:hypothetical protein